MQLKSVCCRRMRTAWGAPSSLTALKQQILQISWRLPNITHHTNTTELVAKFVIEMSISSINLTQPWAMCWSHPECDEYIWIFKYSNIFITNIYSNMCSSFFSSIQIYSDIRSYRFPLYEHIQIFIRIKTILWWSLTNIRIFKYSRNFRN